jgi:metallo-beta-lactamase family protein
MKLTFLGANRQVTGSCYCLEVGDLRVMVDHGMFQEREFLWRNWETCPIAAPRLDALLLTHAHLDHVGRLPKLVAEGFRGPVITTEPTVDLADIILSDSARLQEEDAAYKRKRHARERRRDARPAVPLYTPQDVQRTLPLLRGVKYRQPVKLNGEVTVTFHNAGHILGSAMIEVVARGRRIVFSGDIGQIERPFIEDPSVFQHAEVVVMESTYGDRDHEAHRDVETALADVVNRTVPAGGNLIVPTFAMERAQELVYHLGRLMRAGRIPKTPVFLDSPMAAAVTDVFDKHRGWFDEATRAMLDDGHELLDFPQLTFTRTVAESKAINRVRPAIILAGNGMCTGGRIKHHLVQNITDSRSAILFVGFQSHGTLGRQILDRNKEVRIHGRYWPVNAGVERIDGFSAHADRSGLLRWLSHFKQPPQQLFLTHGEEGAALALAAQITSAGGWNVTVPQYTETVEL